MKTDQIHILSSVQYLWIGAPKSFRQIFMSSFVSLQTVTFYSSKGWNILSPHHPVKTQVDSSGRMLELCYCNDSSHGKSVKTVHLPSFHRVNRQWGKMDVKFTLWRKQCDTFYTMLAAFSRGTTWKNIEWLLMQWCSWAHALKRKSNNGWLVIASN